MTTRCLTSKLGCTHTTVEYHLEQLGFKSKLGVWVPHDLNANQLNQRANICMDLLSYKRRTDWLNHFVTGDDKWVMFCNYKMSRQWLQPGQTPVTTPKSYLHPKKVMLSVWWYVYGVIYWKLLPKNTTITADVYCRQLQKLKSKIEIKGRSITKFIFTMTTLDLIFQKSQEKNYSNSDGT